MEKKDDRVWDCGSPLYDAYELVSIANIIERHMMLLPSTPRILIISQEEEKEKEKTKKQIFVSTIQMKKSNWFTSRFYGMLSRISLMKRCITYV